MRKHLLKLFTPPNIAIIISDIIAIPLLITALVFFSSTDPISIVAYLVSTYALIVSVVGLKRLINHTRQLVQDDKLKVIVLFRRLMHKNKYTGLYLDSKDFRAEVSLYGGLACNLFFATFKVASGIHDRSVWLISIGFYYLALAAVRFMLMYSVRFKKRDRDEKLQKYREYKAYRLCGSMMMFLNLTIAGISIQMIWQNEVTLSSQIAVIITAVYTFYFFISGIINVVSFRKSNNAILLAAKDLAMTGAVMSMFTLQNTMLHTFGGADDNKFRMIMNLITGGFVLIIALGIASFMIISGTKKLNYYKNLNK